MKAKTILFESPDHVTYNGKVLEYDKEEQRSFIIFPNKEVWMSKPGETHVHVYRYPIKNLTTKNTISGRVWLEAKILSMWLNLVQVFGKEWQEYLRLLDEALKKVDIDIRELKIDMYGTWHGMNKKVASPELMATYYDDENNTPFFTYDEFVKQMRYNYEKTSNDVVATQPLTGLYGSKKTGWDSKNNIKHRQSKYTSESFYPIIFK